MRLSPKSPSELEAMRASGKILNTVLAAASRCIAPNLKLTDLDAEIDRLIRQAHARPSFLGYKNYPASSCLSVNSVVVHGIPDDYRLLQGDIVGVDVGVLFDGYHTDAAFTQGVGAITSDATRLLKVTQAALAVALEAAIAGNKVRDIGDTIEAYVRQQGEYGIIRDLSGHGVGQNLWEQPSIPNYVNSMSAELINGLTLAIEPMISLGDWRVAIDPDGWTIRTRDGSLAAQFETTIIIDDNSPEILVDWPLQNRTKSQE